MEKERLDQLVVSKGLARSREESQRLIRAGKILVSEERIDKPGKVIEIDKPIRSTDDSSPFVSRGGEKLAGALERFSFDVKDLRVADFGASTGGFTDCLLQNGAKEVYAFDVGYGQLHEKLRQDPRVKIFDRTNVRYVEEGACGEPVDLVTIDVSFISLKLVLESARNVCRENGHIIALIKPQFEIGKGKLGKGGVVRNPEDHLEVLNNLADWIENNPNLVIMNICPSPLQGPKGNREYPILLRKKIPGENETEKVFERLIFEEVVREAWKVD